MYICRANPCGRIAYDLHRWEILALVVGQDLFLRLHICRSARHRSLFLLGGWKWPAANIEAQMVVICVHGCQSWSELNWKTAWPMPGSWNCWYIVSQGCELVLYQASTAVLAYVVDLCTYASIVGSGRQFILPCQLSVWVLFLSSNFTKNGKQPFGLS